MSLDPRLNIRRRMAQISFFVILLTLCAVLGIVFWGNDGSAARLTAATGITSTILLCLVGIVTEYVVCSQRNDEKDNE